MAMPTWAVPEPAVVRRTDGATARAAGRAAPTAGHGALHARLLALQAMAGNAAVDEWLRAGQPAPSVQRCGAAPCDCPEAESVQRQDDGVVEDGAGADGGGDPLEGVVIVGQPDDPDEAPGGDAGGDLQAGAGPGTGGAGCSYDTVHMGFRVGAEAAGCRVPDDQKGVSRVAYFKIVARGGAAMPSQVDERFTAIEDPYGAAGKLQPQAGSPKNGLFDDCYAIYGRNGLPGDFRLKVEQNHLISGQVASKNEITYTADRIDFCQHPRLQGTCDFGARCRR